MPVLLLFTIFFVGVLVFVDSIILSPSHQADTNDKAISALQKSLQDQVDTDNGAPRSGRDPASQNQIDLASAASKPTFSKNTTDHPAANVGGDHQHDATNSDVFGTASSDGLGFNGCYVDYGKPGEQCLPAHAAINGKLTCEGVREHFPDGIIVSGTDRYHLDANKNGTACDPND